MTTTLCGHERDALFWALEHANASEAGQVIVVCHGESPRSIAYEAVYDPAKLAELMAEELLRLGITDSLLAGEWYMLPLPCENGVEIIVEDPDGLDCSVVLTMPQARAALLRIMQLPEGTSKADVLKALEVAP